MSFLSKGHYAALIMMQMDKLIKAGFTKEQIMSDPCLLDLEKQYDNAKS